MTGNFIAIGHTNKTFGTDGEIKVFVKDRFLEDFADSSFIFLEIKGNKVPFFVESLRFTNVLLVKVEDVDSPEAAIELTGKEIFLREEDMASARKRKKERGPDQFYERYIGFMIKDATQGEVGRIQEIIELPQQVLAVVTYRERELLVPLNDAFIKKAEEGNQTLLMALPEGLLDL
jgi:16S rRNA processing protein RimM